MLGKVEGRSRRGWLRMLGWHHRINGHEFEQTPRDSEGQGSLACCSLWVGCRESDNTEQQKQGGSSKYENRRGLPTCASPHTHPLWVFSSLLLLDPLPCKHFMPEACGHIPYRAVMVWICCLCWQNLDLLVGGFSLSLWCNGNSRLWSQRLGSAGYSPSQPQFSGL